jgi:glycosyltransferase involved in cell wall biosynthesis
VSELPFCSIIVPTHRRPAQLGDCLTALAALDYPRERYEVIVVDDGGGAVPAAISGLADATLVARPRAGPAAARNAGAARAHGELLVFTDDDCRPHPDWLRRLAERHLAEPRLALGGRTLNALTNNVFSATSQLIIDVGYAQNNRDPKAARFFTTNNLAVPAAGFRRAGGFDDAFRTSEDRELCDRWIMSGGVLAYVPEAVVLHARELTFAGFVRQNFDYGRGAFRFHRKRRRSPAGPVAIEPSYYAALVRAALRAGRRGPTILALLLVWHLANSAGFAWQWFRLASPRWYRPRALAARWH